MRYTFLLLSIFFSFYACRKDEKITNDSSAKLEFSVDTILFDTVFTTAGSTVAALIIHNSNDKKVLISSIRLAGGSASAYRLNIDGVPADRANNIAISGNDSLFIFVEVTVDPNNSLSPFLVNDSIEFITNGNLQYVQLVAYGQNAHYFRPDTNIPGYPPFSVIPCNSGNEAHWTNDLPYVIFGYAVVDSGCLLKIDPGVQVHFHKGGGLWVYEEGAIEVNGTKDNPVVFQGDRLESFYKEEAGQWDRIWINENTTRNNVFNYAIIKNAFIGIQAEIQQTLSTNKLVLNNTIIRNMNGLGIYSTAYNIDATNVVIANCGQQLLGLTLGGTHNFTHCTLANYWTASQRQDPALVLTNYDSFQAIDLNAKFTNCILDGSQDEEFAFDFSSTKLSKYKFINCMLRTQKPANDTAHYLSPFINQDAVFTDKTLNDYRLTSTSFAIDKGTSTVPFVDKDITDYIRTLPADLGAYEFR
jgi:hypothetical protein